MFKSETLNWYKDILATAGAEFVEQTGPGRMLIKLDCGHLKGLFAAQLVSHRKFASCPACRRAEKIKELEIQLERERFLQKHEIEEMDLLVSAKKQAERPP